MELVGEIVSQLEEMKQLKGKKKILMVYQLFHKKRVKLIFRILNWNTPLLLNYLSSAHGPR